MAENASPRRPRVGQALIRRGTSRGRSAGRAPLVRCRKGGQGRGAGQAPAARGRPARPRAGREALPRADADRPYLAEIESVIDRWHDDDEAYNNSLALI